jgi:sugar/nucleoside kinase (ribokinase family)
MRKTDCPVLVYGPAYLDFVIRVDRPIGSVPIDLGSDGVLETDSQDRLAIVCPNGASLKVAGLRARGIPTGRLKTLHDVLPAGFSNLVEAVETVEDLGGMGAGFAAALGGRLVSAIAGERDSISARIRHLLERCRIDHSPVIVSEQSQADSTFIVSSGPFGDKLPIGLRGCHAGLTFERTVRDVDAEVVVVASLKNALMDALLGWHPDAFRILAPSARNCRDRVDTVGRLAGKAELLAVNAAEWATMLEADRQAFEASDAILSVTRGPDGARISWRDQHGVRRTHFEPVFPRSRPPVDTNRAGEAFASNFVMALREHGGSAACLQVDEDRVRHAARRAAAAAALVLDMPRFGFPSMFDIQEAIGRGSIP